MIPALMCVFALGGTTYGMAEESLAFYALVITVLIAAGLRRADRRRGRPARLRDRDAGLDDQSLRDRHRLRDRGHPDQRRPPGAHRHPARRPGDRHLLRPALRRPREGGSDEVRRLRHEGRERCALPRRERGRRDHADRHPQADPGRLRARVRRDDLRRDPVVGSRDPAADVVVVVPRDDRVVPAVLDRHRGDRPDARGRADQHLRRRRRRPARRGAHHRHRARHHRDHEQRPDHGHRPALGRERSRRHGRRRCSRSSCSCSSCRSRS